MNKNKKSTFFKDFKEFINKGNIIGLAVAVVIGAAFGKIVTSFVEHIIMPIVSLLLGGQSFSELKWIVKKAVYVEDIMVQNEIAFGYGAFIQASIDFLIIAFFIFLLVKTAARAQNRLEKFVRDKSSIPTIDTVPDKSTQEEILTEIRDLLISRKEEED